jgi:hypothetical protein
MPKPIPQSGPYHNKDGVYASFAVIGIYPGNTGCGVLYWAFSLEEAADAADAYRENEYKSVRVMGEGPRREDATEAMMLGLIQNEFGDI